MQTIEFCKKRRMVKMSAEEEGRLGNKGKKCKREKQQEKNKKWQKNTRSFSLFFGKEKKRPKTIEKRKKLKTKKFEKWKTKREKKLSQS